jgi:hypothetical protein
MAAAASSSVPLSQVEFDPKGTNPLSEDEGDMDFSSTPAANIVEMGLSSLVLAANLCPEAATSGKRVKQVHKKGEVHVPDTEIKLKWNIDYKGGKVINVRVVTLKPKEGEEGAGAGAGAGAGSASEGEGAPAVPTAGRKRARKEPTKPEELDVRAHLQVAHDACVAQNKVVEAEALRVLLEKL